MILIVENILFEIIDTLLCEAIIIIILSKLFSYKMEEKINKKGIICTAPINILFILSFSNIGNIFINMIPFLVIYSCIIFKEKVYDLLLSIFFSNFYIFQNIFLLSIVIRYVLIKYNFTTDMLSIDLLATLFLLSIAVIFSIFSRNTIVHLGLENRSEFIK